MLKDKVAIVTGSTSGIGLGIASALAAQQVHVMLNGFGEAATIERLRKDLASQHGIKTGYSPADMSKPTEIAGMVAATERELGRVDILVNNAGIQHGRSKAFPTTAGTRSSRSISRRRFTPSRRRCPG
jgi:3-hydroxybutyrate dehydrogenase